MSLAAYLANLESRRDAVAEEIAELDSTKAGGKPDVSGGEGVNIAHQAYKKGLYEELDRLQGLIDKAKQDNEADSGNLGIVETQEYP